MIVADGREEKHSSILYLGSICPSVFVYLYFSTRFHVPLFAHAIWLFCLNICFHVLYRFVYYVWPCVFMYLCLNVRFLYLCLDMRFNAYCINLAFSCTFCLHMHFHVLSLHIRFVYLCVCTCIFLYWIYTNVLWTNVCTCDHVLFCTYFFVYQNDTLKLMQNQSCSFRSQIILFVI